MIKCGKKFILVFVVLTIVSAPLCGSDFATEVISYSGLFGPVPYDDPEVVLGKPTTYIRQSPTEVFACSLVYSAWNRAPDDSKLIVTLDLDDEIVAAFDHKVADDPGNPGGVDFIVFGNTAFKVASSEFIQPDTDMDQRLLDNPTSVLDEWVTVSVAQDPNGPWYTFTDGPFADNLFPTNAFAWDSTIDDWGAELNWLKPVDPNLGLSDFSGLSAADAIDLYNGSAGGTGFDLRWLAPAEFQALEVDPASGQRWIKYIKVTSDEFGEVDGFSDVESCGDYQHLYPPGDLNKDCRVNIEDFVLLAGDWPGTTMTDLATLTANWLECTWQCP